MALTRADITSQLMVTQDFVCKADAQEFVDCFFDTIVETLERGEPIKLTGFGNFDLRVKNSRPGRNPMTGEVVMVTKRKVTTFRAGQKLRSRISRLK